MKSEEEAEKILLSTINAVKNDEWWILRHALNVARLKTGSYFLDGNDMIVNVSPNDVGHYVDGEMLDLIFRAKSLVRMREVLTGELLSRKEDYNSPP